MAHNIFQAIPAFICGYRKKYREHILPLCIATMHGWSNKKSLTALHSGSKWGSLQRQVGRNKGYAFNVLRAAWHFVTVKVAQATERKFSSSNNYNSGVGV